MRLSKKIKDLRSELGWTQSDLAKFSGVSLGSIKRYETDIGNITYLNLEKIAKALKVNVSSLSGRSFNEDTTDVHSEIYKSESNLSAKDNIFIRKLSSSVGAGESVEVEGIEIYDTDTLIPFSQMLFKVRPKNIENLRCMRVDGYSMIPMLYPDSWVIVDISARFDGDGLYIINFSGSFMVKLLQKSPDGTLLINSINKDYQSYQVKDGSDISVQIVGKVLRCVI